MIELLHQWQTCQKLEEKHFNGTFIFPNDLDFLGETTNSQFFCDVFTDMIIKRIQVSKMEETAPKSKLDGKKGVFIHKGKPYNHETS